MLLKKQDTNLLLTLVSVKTKSSKFSHLFGSASLNPYSCLIYEEKNFFTEMIY